MRVTHGAHEEGLEKYQNRLGVAAVSAALLANRDEVCENQQVQTGTQQQQRRPPFKWESDENRKTDSRKRVEEETQDPSQQPTTQRYGGLT